MFYFLQLCCTVLLSRNIQPSEKHKKEEKKAELLLLAREYVLFFTTAKQNAVKRLCLSI